MADIHMPMSGIISIHALHGEGDGGKRGSATAAKLFQSTPSTGRATGFTRFS